MAKENRVKLVLDMMKGKNWVVYERIIECIKGKRERERERERERDESASM